MPEHRVTIPNWLPTSLNAIGVNCWQKKARLKKQDATQIAAHFALARVPRVRLAAWEAKHRRYLGIAPKQHGDPAPVRRRVRLEITLGKGVRARDQDNVIKALLDGLKQSGYLYDDSPKWCEVCLPFRYERGERTATTIILEDLEPYVMAKAGKDKVRACTK